MQEAFLLKICVELLKPRWNIHVQQYTATQLISTTHGTSGQGFCPSVRPSLSNDRQLGPHGEILPKGAHKEDKRRIKVLLKQFVPDLFFTERGILSDDEKDDDDDMEVDDAPDKDAETGETTSETSKDNELADKVKTEKVETPEPTDEKVVKDTKSEDETMEVDTKQEEDSDKCEVKAEDAKSTSDENEDDDDDSDLIDDDVYSLFYVNNNWYLFFRLHQILCERLYTIYCHSQKIAEDEALCRKDRKESTAIALRLKAPSDIEADEYFPYFLDMVKNLLDGNLESGLYEDQLREMYGIHAYIGFTMDKLVQNIVRQLQHIATEESCAKVSDLFEEEKANKATGGRIATVFQRQLAEAAYQKRAEAALAEENCFKVSVYKKEVKLTIELLDTEREVSEDPVEVERWSEYVEKYVNNEDSAADELRDLLDRKPVFLSRNVRQWRQRNKDQRQKTDDYDTSDDAKDVTGDNTNNSNNNNDSNKENNTTVKSEITETPDEKPEKLAENSEKEGSMEKDSEMDDLLTNPSDDIDIIDNTECKFNVNSFKLVYVVNSESYLYKRMALKRARQSHKTVSLQLHEKFVNWVEKWRETNVTVEMERSCEDWLMGETEDNRPCETTVNLIDAVDISPYYKYAKYKVCMFRDPDTESVE